MLIEKSEMWEINKLWRRDILSLLILLQIISTELCFTLTKQDLAPIALFREVRRTFKDHKDNMENFPSFCMSSGCQGRGPSFCISLVFAIFPDSYQEHSLLQQQGE